MPTFRGKPACACLVAWLPVYEAELKRRGVIKQSLDIYQLIGGAPQSAGTHRPGGAYDVAQVSDEAILVAREMGAAAWHRPHNWDHAGGIEHQHGVLRGCPHNAGGRYQITALDAGYNGLGHLGRGARDTGPRPSATRTWRQGIKWAKKQATTHPTARLLERPIQHDTHYARGNSHHGDLVAAKRGVWGDRDLQRSAPSGVRRRRVPIGTHWPHPKTEGFASPAGHVPARPFAEIKLTTILTLRTRDGYGIRTAYQEMRDAKAAGMPGIEFELKFVPSRAMLHQLAKGARKVWGRRWQQHVEIKMLHEFDWRPALFRAHEEGFTTTLIHYSGRPESLPHYVDQYRRP